MTSYVAVAPVVLVARATGDTATIFRDDPVPGDATSTAITHLLAINYIAEGGSGTPVSSNGVPLPSTGDAGKVLTVNDAEDGYELDAPGGGVTFPAGDAGYTGGMLAVEYDGAAMAITGSTAVHFDTSYSDETTSDSAPMSSPVDTTDLTLSTSGITPKSSGLYSMACQVNFNAPLDSAAVLEIAGVSPAGSARLPIPAGVDVLSYAATLLWREGSSQALAMAVTGAGGETAELSYAFIAMMKLADAAPLA